MKVCIVIPCYNEEKRLDLEKYKNFLDIHTSVTILFVNDGSSDSTLSRLKEFTKDFTNADYLNLEQNMGKANAVRAGMLKAFEVEYDLYAYMDADLAVELDEVPHFVNIFQLDNIQLVMGSRWMRLGSDIKRKVSRHYIGRIFATLASISLGLKVYDTQCGAKFFRRDLASYLFKDKLNAKWLFDVELLFRYMKNASYNVSNVFEYPVQKWTDVDGSKLKLRDFLKAPFELLDLIIRYK